MVLPIPWPSFQVSRNQPSQPVKKQINHKIIHFSHGDHFLARRLIYLLQ